MLQTPLVMRSVGNVLSLCLEVSLSNITVGNFTVCLYFQIPASVYNGSFLAPTLSVFPGDHLEILLVNNLQHNITSLHFHGMAVSPMKPQDNSFITIQPGKQFPSNHASGLYWYHTHAMHITENQLFGGLSGAIDVQGILDSFT
mmetsp:Transcript_26554/g.37379  ORF Transcript_26554/g.37379 Transcript_26554/m.37379 type:complete len:144 (-) Transcript_26554:908-1339(-)